MPPSKAVDKKYRMPMPSPVVVWRNAPGGGSCIAVVTNVGSNAISLMLFPPDSRVGIPKDSVRYVGDPDVSRHVNSDSGVWEETDETKLLKALAAIVIPNEDGKAAPVSQDLIAFASRFVNQRG